MTATKDKENNSPGKRLKLVFANVDHTHVEDYDLGLGPKVKNLKDSILQKWPTAVQGLPQSGDQIANVRLFQGGKELGGSQNGADEKMLGEFIKWPQNGDPATVHVQWVKKTNDLPPESSDGKSHQFCGPCVIL